MEGDCFVVYGMTVKHCRLQYNSADPFAQILTPLRGTVAYPVGWSKSCGGTMISGSETLSLQGLGWTLF